MRQDKQRNVDVPVISGIMAALVAGAIWFFYMSQSHNKDDKSHPSPGPLNSELQAGMKSRTKERVSKKTEDLILRENGLSRKLDRSAIPDSERFTWQPKELVAVVGNHRQRLWGNVHQIAYSPDSKRLIVAATDSLIRIRDSATLREIMALPVIRGGSDVVCFSPNGKLLAAGGQGVLYLIDMATDPPRKWASIRSSRFGDSSWDCCFSTDSRLLAVTDFTARLRLFDLSGAQPRLIKTIKHPDSVTKIALSRNARMLATLCNETVRIWDLSQITDDTPKLVKRTTGLMITDMLFTADAGSLVLATGCGIHVPGVVSPSTGDVLFWKITKKGFQDQYALLMDEDSPVTSLSLSSDGSLLACSSRDNKVHVWAIGKNKPRLRFVIQDHKPDDFLLGCVVALAPDGKSLAIARREFDDLSIHVWDISGAKPHLLVGDPFQDDWFHEGSLSLAPDGKTLAGWRYPIRRGQFGEGGEVCLWDLSGLRPRERASIKLPYQGATILLSPDNRTLAICTASEGDCIQLWDFTAPRPRLINRLRVPESYRIDCISFSPDGAFAVAGVVALSKDKEWTNYVLYIWDIRQKSPGRFVMILQGNDINIDNIAFSPKGDYMATAGVTGKIQLWRRQGEKMQILDTQKVEHHRLRDTLLPPKPHQYVEPPNLSEEDLDTFFIPPFSTVCFGPDDKFWLTELFKLRGVWRCRLRCWNTANSPAPLHSRPCLDTVLILSTTPRDSDDDGVPIKQEGPLLVVRPESVLLYVNDTLCRIDTKTGNKISEQTLPGPISAASLTPDGRYLATANGNGTIYILRLEDQVHLETQRKDKVMLRR